MDILIAAVVAWFIAQAWKVIHNLYQTRRLDWRLMTASGGMPSSHSALVCATSTKVGMISGFSSPLFAVCVVFSLVIMYDAAGVRQSVGIQAKLLNQLMEDYYETKQIDVEKVKEILGHTAFQVIIGSVIGIGVALIL